MLVSDTMHSVNFLRPQGNSDDVLVLLISSSNERDTDIVIDVFLDDILISASAKVVPEVVKEQWLELLLIILLDLWYFIDPWYILQDFYWDAFEWMDIIVFMIMAFIILLLLFSLLSY